MLGRKLKGATAALAALAALLVLGAGGSSAATSADVSITASDSPDPVTVGAPLSYSAQVSNAGPDAASAVKVTDKLPSSVTFVSASASKGSCSRSGHTVTCSLGTLAAPSTAANVAPATVTINVLAPTKAKTITNSASVGGTTADPKSQNNLDTESTSVVAAGSPPRCAGRTVTIIGTQGDDFLRGSPRSDVILALGGNDRIIGLGGRDVICARGGFDVVKAGAQDDRVYGGSAADKIFGEAGADTLVGGRGRDRLVGGRGPDRLIGGPGNDRCAGGPARDHKHRC